MEEIGEEILLTNSRVQTLLLLGDKQINRQLNGAALKRCLNLLVITAGGQLQVLLQTMDLGVAQQQQQQQILPLLDLVEMLGVEMVVLKIQLLNHLEKPGEKLFLVLLGIIFGVLKPNHLRQEMEVGVVAVRLLLQLFQELNLLLMDGVLVLLMVGVQALLLLVDQIIVLVILGDKIQILMEVTVERVASNVVKKDTCHGNALKEVEDNNEKEEGILLLLHQVVVLNVVKRVICQENVQMRLRRSQAVSNAVRKVICLENVLKVEVVEIVMDSSNKNELALNVEMKITCLENAQMQVEVEVEIINKNVHASNVEMNLICQENVQQLVEITVEEGIVDLEEEHASNVEKTVMFLRIVLRIKVHRNVLIAKVKAICQGNVRMSRKRGKDALTVEMNLISRGNAHKNEKKDLIDRIM